MKHQLRRQEEQKDEEVSGENVWRIGHGQVDQKEAPAGASQLGIEAQGAR